MNKDNNNHKYIRVGTQYFRVVKQPSITGDSRIVLIPWNKDTIRMDFESNYIYDIPKYIGFTCIPSHLNYQKEINDFYKSYHELDYAPVKSYVSKKEIEYSLNFINHIFKEHFDLGLDYLKLLYEKPTQTLPILCLVSKQRSTGKTTFFKWLREIFSFNMTYIKSDAFKSQFNADYQGKLLVAVDEVFFDKAEFTERLKMLSTTDKDKLESKGHDRIEVDFFAKFILCSNRETSFINIDKEEIRFWVRKIQPFGGNKEDVNYLTKLKSEIPYFLRFLLQRDLSSRNESRMWFSPSSIKTEALDKLIHISKDSVEKDIVYALYEVFICLDDSIENLDATPLDINNMIKAISNKRVYHDIKDIRKILKEKWGLPNKNNSNSYVAYEISSIGNTIAVDKKGRYFTISRKFIADLYTYFDENDDS